MSSVHVDIDKHGGEHARNACRGGQHVAEQVERPWPFTGSNLAHIPDGEKAISVLRVLARTDVSNERRTICSVEAFTTSKSGVPRDQVAQWFCLEKTRAEQSRQSLRLEQVRHLARRKQPKGTTRHGNSELYFPRGQHKNAVSNGCSQRSRNRLARRRRPSTRLAPMP